MCDALSGNIICYFGFNNAVLEGGRVNDFLVLLPETP